MSLDFPHPRKFIPENVAEELRDQAYSAETTKSLHNRQLAAIREQNWFNLYVPKRFGGRDLPLPEIIRIEEGIAWADGSSGWVVTLCSGAAWFVGFLDEGLAADVFRSTNVCFAGSGAISGIANLTAGGYEISGFWPYATGSLLATVFTMNCIVQQNGVQMYGTDGKPLVKSFLLKPDEVRIHRTWRAMGMVATGSHSIEVKNVRIPENRSFIIQPDHTTLPEAIFRYPFLQLAESTLTVNLSGMAVRFIDLAESKANVNGLDARNHNINESRLKLQNARQAFYRTTDMVWDNFISGISLHNMPLMITEACHGLVNCCTEVVNSLYPHCGMDAADTEHEINRVWRNFHTATQHTLFRSRLNLH